jgi:hypothetical protein
MSEIPFIQRLVKTIRALIGRKPARSVTLILGIIWAAILIVNTAGRDGAPVAAVDPAADAGPRNLVELNGRVFDFGADVSKVRRDPDFFPVTDVAWVRAYLEQDPAFASVVMHLEDRAPPFVIVPWVKDLPEYVDPRPAFQVPGWQARSNAETATFPEYGFLRMIATQPAWATCRQETDGSKFGSCGLFATYSEKATTVLMARIYDPVPPYPFDHIVRKMAAVARCLDVTEAVAAGTHSAPPQPLPGYGEPPATDDPRIAALDGCVKSHKADRP